MSLLGSSGGGRTKCSIGLALLFLVAGCGVDRVAANPVNVVLIVIDTLRPDFLGTYGGNRSATPHIDGLAADGIVFETAVSPSPMTGPSHAALFTSRHPSELGVVNNAANLPDRVPVMAEILAQAGFDTGAAIAIAPIRRQWGFDRGFRIFEEDQLRNTWILNADTVLPQTLDILDRLKPPFFLWSHLADPHAPYKAHGAAEYEAEVLVNGRTIGRVPTSASAVQRIDFELQRGLNELEIRSEHFFRIHRLSMRHRGWFKPDLDPARPPPEYLAEYRAEITSWRSKKVQLVVQLSDRVRDPEILDRYAGEVAYVDRNIGLLIDRLKSMGLYEESLILLTSDHGQGLGCHGYGGHVETLYDCMVRVPLIVKPPRSLGFDVGQRRDDLAGLVDVLPTVLGVLALEPRPQMRGRDLLDPTPVSAPAILMETHRPQAQKTLLGLRGQSHSIIFDATAEAWEFYDLAQDPDQLVNLYDLHNPLVVEWTRRLQQRLRDEAQPLPGVDVKSEIDDEAREMLRSLGYL